MSGAALPFMALAMQTVGGIGQSIGANAEANAAAAVDEENARLSILAGEQDVAQVLRAERMAAGEAIASMAGSGAALGYGTAADIITESAMQRDRDILALRNKAIGEASNYQQAAADKRAAGRNAMIAGAFNTVAGVLNGVGDIRNQRLLNAQTSAERAVRLGGSALVPHRQTGTSRSGGGSLPDWRKM